MAGANLVGVAVSALGVGAANPAPTEGVLDRPAYAVEGPVPIGGVAAELIDVGPASWRTIGALNAQGTAVGANPSITDIALAAIYAAVHPSRDAVGR